LADGMFMDGLIYATVSHNLANGIGSFWDLFLTETLYKHFHEHPPLAMGIQSLFFKLFGNSIYIERIYSVSTILISATIINKIWKRVAIPNYRSLAWLALLFTALIPLITWSATNNMLENTMMIFTLLSILFIIKSTETSRVINILLAGFMLALAVLTKGLVALYPLSFFFWIMVFNKKYSFKQFFTDSAMLTIGLILPFILLFIFIPESYDSLMAYFNKQIVGSIKNVQTVDSRFWIIGRLLQELIIPAIIIIIITLITRKTKLKKVDNIWIFPLLAIGLSGVLPIMISMKQSGFYILTTFPIFAIVLSLFIAPNVSYLFTKININGQGFKVFRALIFTLLIVSLGLNINKIGGYGRDKDKLEDVYKIIDIIPKGSLISAESSIRSEWSLHGYFYRHAMISLDTKKSKNNKYLLVHKNSKTEIPNNYTQQEVDLKIFNLYKSKD